MDICLWNNSKFAIGNAIYLYLINVKTIYDLKFPSIKSNEKSWKIVCGIAGTCRENYAWNWIVSTSVSCEIDLRQHRIPPKLVISHSQLNVIYRCVKCSIESSRKDNLRTNFKRIHRHLPFMRIGRLYISPIPVSWTSIVNESPND